MCFASAGQRKIREARAISQKKGVVCEMGVQNGKHGTKIAAHGVSLLRPDTVPDDLPLLVEADGMVTAVGGSTSHAAVAAQRLGRTCVVGCRELSVDEPARRSVLAGRSLETGDFLSINGVDGSVYLGKHPSTIVRRQRLA